MSEFQSQSPAGFLRGQGLPGFQLHLKPGERFVVPVGDSSWSVSISEPSVIELTSCPGTTGLAFRAKAPGSTEIHGSGQLPAGFSMCQHCSPPGMFMIAIIDSPAAHFDTVVPSSEFTYGDPIVLKNWTTFELSFPRQQFYFAWTDLSISDPSVITRVDANSPAGPGLAIFRAMRSGETYITARAQLNCHTGSPIQCLVGDWRFLRLDVRVTASGDVPTTVLADADNGRSLQVEVGQTVRIKLQAVSSEVGVGLSLGHNTQVMLYPIAVHRTAGGPFLEAAFRAVSTGQEEIIKRCNNSCHKDFKVSVRIVPNAEGVAALITDADIGNAFQVQPGTKVVVMLRPEIGPWDDVTTSVPWILQPVPNDAIDVPVGAIVRVFIARGGGETIVKAQSSCPQGQHCAYEVMQDRVDVSWAG